MSVSSFLIVLLCLDYSRAWQGFSVSVRKACLVLGFGFEWLGRGVKVAVPFRPFYARRPRDLWREVICHLSMARYARAIVELEGPVDAKGHHFAWTPLWDTSLGHLIVYPPVWDPRHLFEAFSLHSLAWPIFHTAV